MSVAQETKLNAKFMQTLEKGVYIKVRTMAVGRGVTIQEFLRTLWCL